MEILVATFMGVALGALAFAGLVFLKQRGHKAERKPRTAWLTRQQLTVLEGIAKTGRAGIRLWFTNINHSTIRSLAKRGFVDTRSGGRIVATRSGKKRLTQPWPDRPSTMDQHGTVSSHGSNVESIDSKASGAASAHDSLT